MVLEVAGKMFSVRKLVVWSVYICVQYRQSGDICVQYRQWGGGGHSICGRNYHLLAKCNASRRQIGDFFRNL